MNTAMKLPSAYAEITAEEMAAPAEETAPAAEEKKALTLDEVLAQA